MVIFLTVVGILVLLAAIFAVFHTRKCLLEKDSMEKQACLEEEYYEKLEESQKRILLMQEDIKGYIEEMKQTGETGKVMQNFREKYEKIPQVEYSRHSVVNAVAWDKMMKAKEKETELEYDLLLPEKLEISDMDLISLFGNLLDNAIEAMDGLEKEKRKIFFSAKALKGMLFIRCKNRKSREDNPVENQFKSKKENGFAHGLGRKIVKEIVEKYDGTLKDKDLEDWLETEVILLCGGGSND